ncbi:hypothetical protein DIE14_30150 [Burkholderia sp. Bp9017]|nr:hypothetical protein DIE14_30150 [Burkholderia sp. Bp9017]RQZ29983.1 hypothetical protein DIE13_25670 [Burkholderia sp. Bp9016]
MKIRQRAHARATLSSTVGNPSARVNRAAADPATVSPVSGIDPSRMAMNPAVGCFSELRAKAAVLFPAYRHAIDALES